MHIQVPYNFVPRDYQIPFLEAFDNGFRRLIWVVHRRAGKDKTCMNIIAKEMFQKVGTYFYFLPTYKQGKKIVWNGMDKDGFKFIHHIPKETWVRKDNQEMLIEIQNGSIFQVVGTDSIDSIVGTNPVGCVFSEYSLQSQQAWDFISPILAENGGWAIFNFTPRGENHAYELLQMAEADPSWWTQVLTVDDTNAINKEFLQNERRQYIHRYGDDALFNQEYYCSFTAPLQGSYYAPQMSLAEEEGRITDVPFEPALEVHTSWDLGMDDATTIWFFQVISSTEFRFIDYFESSGEGIQYYIEVLKQRARQYGYQYGTHYFPHDFKVKELGTGESRRDTAVRLGMPRQSLKVLPRISSTHEGIQAVRNILQHCWFDKEKCKIGIRGLKSYKKEWDDKRETYKSSPVHDKASHAADSFRQFACGWRERQPQQSVHFQELDLDPYF